MGTASRTSSDRLLPIVIARMFRLLARLWRGLRSRLRSIPAIRDISDEAFHTDFTAEEQYGHETLLADAVRMHAYRAAVERHIKPDDVVVDLGTGTGILALLAAQRARRVHAIELSDIIGLAERLANANHFKNIDFHNITSRRFTTVTPVNVILHEQIGQALIDEGLIEKTLDLKNRVLTKTGRILPGKFELFLEPAAVKEHFRVPYLWQAEFPGIDFASLRDLPAKTTERRGYDWQVGARPGIDYLLCDPSPILVFDLNEIHDPSAVASKVSASRLVRRSGRLDGFCLYFRVIFDDELQFDTGPFSPRTHWENLFVRVESREHHAGDTIAYSLDMVDRFDHETWLVQVAT